MKARIIFSQGWYVVLTPQNDDEKRQLLDIHSKITVEVQEVMKFDPLDLAIPLQPPGRIVREVEKTGLLCAECEAPVLASQPGEPFGFSCPNCEQSW